MAKPTPHQLRLQDALQFEEDKWQLKYKYVKKHSISTRKRVFMTELFTSGPYTNARFVHAKVKTSQACQYCNDPYQDFIHLFLECPEVTSLRTALTAKWPRPVTKLECALGTDNNSGEEKAMSFVLLEFIFYVQRANWANENLSLSSFKGAVRAIEVVEGRIAIKNNRPEKHRTKWEEIFKLIA